MIAVDMDYTGQTGYVGSPVSGAYVRQAPHGRGLHPARDIQCGAGIAGNVDRTYPGVAIARRRPGGRSEATGCDWIC